jgi:hypothetical protein
MDFDWKQLAGPLVSAGGSILGGVIGGPAGAVLGPMIGGVVADALGVPATPDAVGAALNQPGAAEKVAQVQAASGPAILSAQDAYLADIASARIQTVELAKVGSKIAWSAPLISTLVVVGFLGLVGALLWRAIPDNQVTMMLIGALSAGFQQVLSYWLGSSKGSSDKTAELTALVKKLAPLRSA